MQPNLKILDIFIGNMCNLTCFQCDTRSDVIRTTKYDPDMISIKRSILLAEQCFEIETYSILGGEPLIYLDTVTEIVKFIREHNPTARILVPSNGTLLERKLEYVANLITTYNVCFAICDHFAAFPDKTRSNEIKKYTKLLVDRLQFSSQDPMEFFNDWLDWKNVKQDNLWQNFLNARRDMMDCHYTDEVWTNGTAWVHYKDQQEFQSHYYFNNGKPKPFMSSDPQASYINSCCSTFCSFLHDGKLYKCGALGTLERFLEHYNAKDDTDWQKYLAYKPLDLANCTDEEIVEFSNTKYTSVAVCDMCPSTTQKYIKTPETVIPIRLES